MIKSKQSPKKLPPNQTGLYSILDPHREVEEILINWYENMVLLAEAVPPSNLLWGDYFTNNEIFQFIDKINKVWSDFDNKAYFDFQQLMSLFEYKGKTNQRHQKSTPFDNQYYLKEICHRIGCYKSLLYIKPVMNEIILRKDRIAIFKSKYNDICVTPGQPEQTLLHVLIQDIEQVSGEYFTKRKNKPYRAALAFYLAKQDIFKGLNCVHKSKSEEWCSTVDCISVKRINCMNTIRRYSQRVTDIDSSIMQLCEKNFKYSACKECIRNFAFQTNFDPPELFLRTPCKVAIAHYNDILERIKRNKHIGKPKAMHIRDIDSFQIELNKARLDKCRKAITAIFNKAQGLYPHLTRKKIQRILSQ